VTDDESGLVYMRARYYEPGMGRFVSEDQAMDGTNWYSYCSNEPVDRADCTGRVWEVSNLLGTAFISLTGALAVAGGYLLGFLATVALIQLELPGFRPTVDFISVFISAASAVLGAVMGKPSMNLGGGIHFKNLATRYFSRAAGYGFVFGLLAGAYAAKAAFEIWYGDNFDKVN
jgi:hypothetical protein